MSKCLPTKLRSRKFYSLFFYQLFDSASQISTIHNYYNQYQFDLRHEIFHAIMLLPLYF